MKKFETILLDQDGVLASFTVAVITQLNKRLGTTVTLDDVIESNNWNLEEQWDLPVKKWWSYIDENPNFWLEIPKFKWANKLYTELQKYADEVVIMTHPSHSPMCCEHKRMWLWRKLRIPAEDVMLGKKKYLLANNRTLLIDDSLENCQKFEERGGHTVCVPSDWNTKNLNFEMVWSSIDEKLK